MSEKPTKSKASKGKSRLRKLQVSNRTIKDLNASEEAASKVKGGIPKRPGRQ